MEDGSIVGKDCHAPLAAAPVARPPVCPVCGMALDADVVHCTDCQTAHHQECWRYNRGCSTYACPSRSCAPDLPPQRSIRSSMRDGERLELVLPSGETPEFAVAGPAAFLSLVLAAVVLRPEPGPPIEPRSIFFLLHALFVLACILTTRTVVSSAPGGDHLDRTTSTLGVEWCRRPAWLRRQEVVEVHVYGEPPVEVVAVCASGEIRSVAWQRSRGAARDLRPAAAAVAAWADCAIVEYGNRERPTSARLAAPSA